MRVFFPNGTIVFPPTKGPHIHKYQLTKNLAALGYDITTFRGDQNPLVEHRSKTPLEVLRLLRNSDVIYLRTGEGPNNATRLTSRAFRRLVPKKTAVIWEMNLDFNLKVRRIPRTNMEIHSDLRALRTHAEGVDAAICVTEAIAHQARDLLGIKHTYVIPNGSDPDMFRPDLPKMRFEDHATGPEALDIAWIASESNAIHDVALVVQLASLIEEHGLPMRIHAMGHTEALFPIPRPSSVVVHGPVSYLDLPRYLASMDVGLVLYNIKYDGGSPLKLFDYCASGCVPICSPGKGIEDVLNGSGVGYVGWWTPESICNALDSLRQDPGKRKSMSRKGRKLIETQYNWVEIAKKTDQVIQDSVSRRSTSY